MKESIQNFSFVLKGYGHYIVRYKSPKTGRLWFKTIDNMQLIDSTKNSDHPSQKNLVILKRLVKN